METCLLSLTPGENTELTDLSDVTSQLVVTYTCEETSHHTGPSYCSSSVMHSLTIRPTMNNLPWIDKFLSSEGGANLLAPSREVSCDRVAYSLQKLHVTIAGSNTHFVKQLNLYFEKPQFDI
ncbi:hypothetical protein E2C01_012043 [Portunus trituberculatus]|uniref:Uncharacterized protein n=1 Tax=Portunus trituberculatus TaxID=210409 RepID=A0A5B7DDG4_PORTR|nr:hypothetical protein [Portunus trituberculatus]